MLIEKYTPKWITHFEDLKSRLLVALAGVECVIEHIGSTSVPNLDAKPIIDIDIIYFDAQDFDRIKCMLEKIGYYHHGNQGIEGREVFKRGGKVLIPALEAIKHHLYVCPMGSKELERHILFRNYLRENEWARITYQQTKYELADEANQDRKKYQALKELRLNNFIENIIQMERGEGIKSNWMKE
jgi:GrpB-like predicted nucleotidyltransferase (UPF0157 family)